MDSNDHTSSEDIELLVTLGEVLCRAAEPDEAEAVLTQALDIQPNNPHARAGLGLALQGQQRYLAAAEQFIHAIRIEPYYPEHHWRLAWSLIGADRLVEAEPPLRTALLLDPQATRYRTDLECVLRYQGRPQEAEAISGQTGHLPPLCAEFLATGATTAPGTSRGGDIGQRTEGGAHPAHTLDWRFAPAYTWFATVLTEHGATAQAEAAFRIALLLDPTYARAYGGLGGILVRTRRLTEASRVLRDAIRWGPGNSQAHSQLSWVLRCVGQVHEAEAAARTAIRLDPTGAHGHAALAHTLNAQGRYEEAASTCDVLILAGMHDADLHSAFGRAVLALGAPQTAQHAFEAALAICPQRAVDWCNLGEVLTVTGRLAEAEDAYRRAISEDGGHPAAHTGLAWLHLVQGRRDAAYLALNTSIQLDPAGPAASRAQLLLGALDAADGRTTAQAHFAAALKVATHPSPSLDHLSPFRLRESAALAHAALGNLTNAVAALQCAMPHRAFPDRFEPQLYALLRQARGPALDRLVEVWGPDTLVSQPFAAPCVPPEGPSVMPNPAAPADIQAQPPAAASPSPLPHRAGEGTWNRVRRRDVVVPAIGGVVAAGGALLWPGAQGRSALWDAPGDPVLAIVCGTLLMVCCLSLRFPHRHQDLPVSPAARRPFVSHRAFVQRLLRRSFPSTSTGERRKR